MLFGASKAQRSAQISFDAILGLLEVPVILIQKQIAGNS